MPVYEPVPHRKKAEILSQLMLARSRSRDGSNLETRLSESFIPDLISNLRRSDYTPSPRQLYALSQHLSVTIGGAFKLFGYSLESMRQLDFLLNGTRTRFIESYPFYRDRLVSVPETLGDPSAFQRTSVLSDVVRSWRTGVPVRAIHGPNWRRQRLLYAQIGTSDGLSLPTIPPGAIVAICEISESEQRQPNADKFYFLQHRAGYSCCRCLVDNRRLHLITKGQKVGAQSDFAYPGEVRIVGQVVFFGVRLPVLNPRPAVPIAGQIDAPLILPWEHSSFSSLVAAERRRFGITDAQIATTAPVLAAQLGVTLSPRTLRRYQHGDPLSPRTAAFLTITSTLSLRFSDVLRVSGLWSSENQKLSLTTLVEHQKAAGGLLSVNPPPSPEPHARWQDFLKIWGEWSTLLSVTHPNPSAESDNLLLFNSHGGFKGLDALIRDGSIMLVDPLDVSPPRNGAAENDEWARPIFALRHGGEIVCGYLECNDTHFAIQPHSHSGVPRLIFRRSRIQVLGRVSAVASPLRTLT